MIRITIKTFSLFLFPVFLCGCGTSKTIQYPYEKVSVVLKKKLVDEHDDFLTSAPEVTETSDSLEISFSTDLDFYFSIDIDVSLKKKGEDESIVTAEIMEYYKSWSYQSRNEKMEEEFLDLLEKRLKSGKWKKLPWDKKTTINTDIIPAIIDDF